MASGPPELTTRARIARAALEGFVAAGVAVPSVRAIARAAAVSPGSVQHFFPTQSALRAAVNEHVTDLLREAFASTVSGTSGTAVGTELGHRLTLFFHDHPVESRYLARTLTDQDETADELFAALMGLSVAQWSRLDHDGLLRDGLDLRWAALHVVIVNVGTILLEELITQHLSEPLLSDTGLARWRLAQTELFHGLYRATEGSGPCPTDHDR